MSLIEDGESDQEFEKSKAERGMSKLEKCAVARPWHTTQ